jgi:hypothetical protein
MVNSTKSATQVEDLVHLCSQPLSTTRLMAPTESRPLARTCEGAPDLEMVRGRSRSCPDARPTTLGRAHTEALLT